VTGMLFRFISAFANTRPALNSSRSLMSTLLMVTWDRHVEQIVHERVALPPEVVTAWWHWLVFGMMGLRYWPLPTTFAKIGGGGGGGTGVGGSACRRWSAAAASSASSRWWRWWRLCACRWMRAHGSLTMACKKVWAAMAYANPKRKNTLRQRRHIVGSVPMAGGPGINVPGAARENAGPPGEGGAAADW